MTKPNGIFDPSESLRAAIPHIESFQDVLMDMREFHDNLCNLVAGRSSFTIKLEVRGDCGEILHTRVSSDAFRHPHGVEKRIEAEKKRQ